MVYKPDFNPQVYTKVEDSGILLTIRYLCNPRKRRITSQMIWEDILEHFSSNDSIDFAYPTTRFYKTETDKIHPLNNYANQKLIAEKKILQNNQNMLPRNILHLEHETRV